MLHSLFHSDGKTLHTPALRPGQIHPGLRVARLLPATGLRHHRHEHRGPEVSFLEVTASPEATPNGLVFEAISPLSGHKSWYPVPTFGATTSRRDALSSNGLLFLADHLRPTSEVDSRRIDKAGVDLTITTLTQHIQALHGAHEHHTSGAPGEIVDRSLLTPASPFQLMRPAINYFAALTDEFDKTAGAEDRDALAAIRASLAELDALYPVRVTSHRTESPSLGAPAFGIA